MRKKSSPSSSETLYGEDRILWNRVTKTVTSITTSAQNRVGAHDEDVWQEWLLERDLVSAPPPPALQPKIDTPKTHNLPPINAPSDKPEAQAKQKRMGPIERPTYRKIAKGRLPIDASIDLHNLTQDQAHGRLLSFLQQAHQRRCRHVLVVTGKGRSANSEGILRRMLPHWFATPPFSHLVSGFRHAARDHGGEGAWYVRLRKDQTVQS